MKQLHKGISFFLILILLCHFPPPVLAASGTSPVNPAASDQARTLLQTLYNIKGKGMITGMYNWHAVPHERTDKLKGITGKYAGIWNTDFGYGGSGQDMNSIRQEVINTAKRQARAGDIVSLMWHEVKPSDGETAGWGSVQGYYSDAEYDLLLTEGTTLHNQWLNKIDEVAGYLKQLQDADIPVLWRPYHEPNLACFWWGKNGGERFNQLWKQMYDRYTNYHGLNNLIWVWGAGMGSASNMYEYYPGNAYVDVLGVDIYQDNPQYNQAYYEALKKIANGKPIGISECGKLPDVNYIRQNQPDYCYFIEWADYIESDSQSPSSISSVYNHPYCYNRGEIPNDLPDVDGPGILPDYDPSEFSDLYVTDKGSDFISLQWSDFETAAAGYKILFNGAPIADVIRTPGTGGFTTIAGNQIPGGMQPNTNYTFTVQPYGGASTGWTWISNTRTITVKTLPPEDAYIASLTAGNNSFTIALANVAPDASNHIVVYNEDRNGRLVCNKDFTGSDIEITDLESASTYRFTITSLDGSFKALEGTVKTSGIRAASVTTTSVTLKWSDFYPDKVLYKIVYKKDGQEISQDVYSLETTITGLTPGTTYEFTVWGVDAGWGWHSAHSISVTTKALNRISTVDNGKVYMDIVNEEDLIDYTLIVSSYHQNRLQLVELFQPQPIVSYTVVPSDKTKAFLWNLETLQPYL